MSQSSSDPKRTEGEPHDRLTRITDRLLSTVEADLEHREGDKCIVFMDDGKRGGIGMHGYDDDAEAMADLLLHLKAIFEANGKTMVIASSSERLADDVRQRAVQIVADYLEQRHDYGGHVGASRRSMRASAEHEADEIVLTLGFAGLLLSRDSDSDE